MTKHFLTPISIFVAAAVAMVRPAGAVELKDVDRHATRFMFYELGHHLPTRDHLKDYSDPREVVSQSIRLPLEITMGAGDRMFCNSQVSGFDVKGRPNGKGNHPKNFTYPQSATMCERRHGNRPVVNLCKFQRDRHYGTDCRPPRPEGNTFFVVAVEDGIITRVSKRNSINAHVYMRGKSGVNWVYRHVSKIQFRCKNNNDRTCRKKVKRGDRLAMVSNIPIEVDRNGNPTGGGTPVHLHFECRVGGVWRDCFPTLMVLQMKMLNIPFKVTNGDLDFNECYEIKAGERRPRKNLSDCLGENSSSETVSGSP